MQSTAWPCRTAVQIIAAACASTRLVLGCLFLVALTGCADVHPVEHDVRHSNLIFIHVPKTGGSTAGGVFRRIAARYGLAGQNYGHYIRPASNNSVRPMHRNVEPAVLAQHGRFREISQFHRDIGLQLPQLYFTLVRDPAERSMSAFYHFDISRANPSKPSKLNDENKLQKLRRESNSIFKYIAEGDPHPFSAEDDASPEACNASNSTVDEQVQRAISSYALIGSTERFDEFMLLLAAQLNLTYCDLLYLRAKDSHSGGLDDTGVMMVPHPPLIAESPAVRAFIASSEFHYSNIFDVTLLSRVNRDMDKRISEIHTATFHRALRTYRSALLLAVNKCIGQSSEWKTEDCYWNDSGCGFRCLDMLCSRKGSEYMEEVIFPSASETPDMSIQNPFFND